MLFSRGINLREIETLALVPYADLLNHSPYANSGFFLNDIPLSPEKEDRNSLTTCYIYNTCHTCYTSYTYCTYYTYYTYYAYYICYTYNTHYTHYTSTILTTLNTLTVLHI